MAEVVMELVVVCSWSSRSIVTLMLVNLSKTIQDVMIDGSTVEWSTMIVYWDVTAM